jgi:hypothetical protein
MAILDASSYFTFRERARERGKKVVEERKNSDKEE